MVAVVEVLCSAGRAAAAAGDDGEARSEFPVTGWPPRLAQASCGEGDRGEGAVVRGLVAAWVRGVAFGSSHQHHDEAPPAAVVAPAVAAFLWPISFAKPAKAQASVVF